MLIFFYPLVSATKPTARDIRTMTRRTSWLAHSCFARTGEIKVGINGVTPLRIQPNVHIHPQSNDESGKYTAHQGLIFVPLG